MCQLNISSKSNIGYYIRIPHTFVTNLRTYITADADWAVYWCPSHLRDDKPPADAAEKLQKARQQIGWKDEFLDLNKEADAHATAALRTAAALHATIAAREAALARAERASADIGAAVAKRLLNARLPGAASSDGARTLDAMWTKKDG